MKPKHQQLKVDRSHEPIDKPFFTSSLSAQHGLDLFEEVVTSTGHICLQATEKREKYNKNDKEKYLGQYIERSNRKGDRKINEHKIHPRDREDWFLITG